MGHLPHLLRWVDVEPLVELVLQRGHHGVVARDPVNAGVLQAHLLHQTTADLHYHGDELVVSTRLAFLQPHTEGLRTGLLGLLHDVDSPRRLRRTALFWGTD